MKIEVKVFVIQTLSYPIVDGVTNYGAEMIWTPTVYSFRMDETDERVFVSEQTVTVAVPDDFNPVPAQVAALKAEEAKALEKYLQTRDFIKARLDKLLALENAA